MVKRALGAGLLVVAALAAALFWRLDHESVPPRAAAEAPPPRVPVVEAVVAARDVPQYLYGMGTVEPMNTVGVKSRVDGEIIKLYYEGGEEVKKGAPLIEIDPRPYEAALDAALAQKDKDAAQLEGAKLDLKRYLKLLNTGFQSRQQYDQQKALVDQSKAAVMADQAKIETARLNLQYTHITAPIAGKLGARLVGVGNILHTADDVTIVTINRLKPILVRFTLPQVDLDAIRDRQNKGALPLAALSAGGESVRGRGRLYFIDNAIDQATGTVTLKGVFPNTKERLWPGQFVEVRVVLRTLYGVPTVPAQTVEEGPQGDFAYVIAKDDTVERRAIAVGESVDGVTVIEKGLRLGERVVVVGQYRLKVGDRVAPRPFKRARTAEGAGAP